MINLFPLALLAIGLLFFIRMRKLRADQGIYLDLGEAFMLVILVYGTLPGIGLALAYNNIGEIKESRLAGGLDIEPITEVETGILLFAVAFAISYALKRKFTRTSLSHEALANRNIRWIILISGGLLLGIPIAKLFLGVQKSDDYIGTYNELQSLPLIYRQLFSIASQLSFSSIVALIVFSIARKPEKHHIVAAGCGAYVLYATLSGGSRSTAFLSFLAYLTTASIYVKGFSIRSVAVLGIPALVLFLVAGILRSGETDGSILSVVQSGEFIALFTNAVDLKEKFDAGFAGEYRYTFYFVDIIRLIPAQLIGGEKIDPATWYVETFYPDYRDAGGGLAFGVIAESFAGLGEYEAGIRGMILGLIFAAAANMLLGKNTSPIKVFVYVWMTSVCYVCYRDTMLSIITRGLYQVAPIIILYSLFNRPNKPQPKLQTRKPNSE